MFTFASGIGSLALLLGFLVGASNSPVAGIALTATFGLATAALSLYQKSDAGDSSENPANESKKTANARKSAFATLTMLGQLFIVFTITFFVGLGGGVYVKHLQSVAEPAPPFPWQGQEAPPSARIAIDWILVQKHLRSAGYSYSQISEIYKFRQQQGQSFSPIFSNDHDLLSPLFVLEKPAQTRIPYIAENSAPRGTPWDPGLREQDS